MSTLLAMPAVAATPTSAHFAADFDVLSDLRARHGDLEIPVVEFSEDRWDFSQVPGRPAYRHTSQMVTDFAAVCDPSLRLTAKELVAAMLCPEHPAVQAVATRRLTPLPVATSVTAPTRSAGFSTG